MPTTTTRENSETEYRAGALFWLISGRCLSPPAKSAESGLANVVATRGQLANRCSGEPSAVVPSSLGRVVFADQLYGRTAVAREPWGAKSAADR